MRLALLIGSLLIVMSCHAQVHAKSDSLFHLHTYVPQTISFRTAHVSVIPQDQYAKNIGFFCKQELKMQQAHIPVTFRLGSMDYVNRMEQKPGYR